MACSRLLNKQMSVEYARCVGTYSPAVQSLEQSVHTKVQPGTSAASQLQLNATQLQRAVHHEHPDR